MKVLKYCLVILLFSSASLLQGAIVNWTGGNGNWNVGANWSNGIGITAIDEAIIPAGVNVLIPNGLFAQALRVEIAVGGRLTINTTGQLNVSNSVNTQGMIVDGILVVRGSLRVNNTTNLGGVAYGGVGILINGRMLVRASGKVICSNTEGIALQLLTTGELFNYGEIKLNNAHTQGIYNDNLIKNFNEIILTNPVGGGTTGVSNNGIFRNYANGMIEMENITLQGWDNNPGSAFYNAGTVKITSSGLSGFNNSGNLVNYATSYIYVENAGLTSFLNGGNTNNLGTIYSLDGQGVGMVNAGQLLNNGVLEVQNSTLESFNNSAQFNNYGSIYSTDSQERGLENTGEFYNHELLDIQNSTDIALYNSTAGVLHNFDRINLLGTLSESISNLGELHNFNTGIVECEEKISGVSGSFINDGILSSSSTTNNFLSIPIDNNGIVEDEYNSFLSTAINNLQVVTNPITGTLQDNVAFANALDAASLANVTVQGWYTDASLGQLAGSYDAILNEFTPDSYAIGLSELYVDITIDATGISHPCRVTISGGVIALVNKQQNDYISDEVLARLAPTTKTGLTVYPNPATDFLTIASEATIQQVSLFNTTGQLVKKYASSNAILGLQGLAAGSYILQVLTDAGMETKRIIVE